eukprot:5790520-Alexandrium_andersonii.AAC.1
MLTPSDWSPVTDPGEEGSQDDWAGPHPPLAANRDLGAELWGGPVADPSFWGVPRGGAGGKRATARKRSQKLRRAASQGADARAGETDQASIANAIQTLS